MRLLEGGLGYRIYMFLAILPILYVSVSTSINEPLTLLRSVLLVTWILIYLILQANKINIKSKWLWTLFLIPAFYVISAFVNKQNPILALLGNYNRNFGVLSLLAVSLLVAIVSSSKLTIRDFLHWALWPITAITIVYGFVQVFGKDPIIWFEPDRTVLTLGNSNYAAALLGVLILLPVYGFLVYKKLYVRFLMILVFAAEIKLGLFSQAFQFRVLSLVSITIFLAVNYRERIRKIRMFIRILVLTPPSALLILYLVNSGTELIYRTNSVDRISQQSMGLRMFLDHPVFGVGVDQFWRFIPQYLRPTDIQRNGSLVVPDKTHNLIIDHLAMGGLLVGLAFAAFLVYSLVITYKLNKLGAELKNRSELALLSGIWITYVIHLFISTDNLFMMTFGYASFGLIAQAYYAKHPSQSKEGKVAKRIRTLSPNVIRIGTAVILLAVSVVNIKALIADAKIKKIVTNQVQSGDEIIQTLRSFPNPKTAEEVVVYLLQNLQNCPVALVASDDLLKLDNRSAQAWYFKTLCSDASNDQKTALSYIEKSLELQPLNLIYWDAKVRLEVRLKDFNAARNSVEQIRSINPEYASLKDLESLISTSITG